MRIGRHPNSVSRPKGVEVRLAVLAVLASLAARRPEFNRAACVPTPTRTRGGQERKKRQQAKRLPIPGDHRGLFCK